MASRALNPLRRMASQQSLIYSGSARSRCLVTASTPKRYPAASPAKSTAPTPAAAAAAAAAAPSKPRPLASTTTSTPPPPKTSTAGPTISRIVRLPPVSNAAVPDAPATETDSNGTPIDWSSSFHGLGTSTFSPEVNAVLLGPIQPDDIEVKPDGIVYLPEIKYRRVLNTAFGPGGWGMAPRSDLVVQDRLVTREYALVVHGRFVGQARGEMQYFNADGISTAAEGCKSNALMRCCKDLGIASELWDPRFIRQFMKENAVQVWVEHATTKKKKQIWLRKDDDVRYPFKRTSS